jgi:Flp pilus assembly pilin Flp
MSKPAFFLSVMQNFWMEEAGISVTGYALLASLCVVVSAVALLAWRSWM